MEIHKLLSLQVLYTSQQTRRHTSRQFDRNKSRYSNGRIPRHITCTSEVEERTMCLSPLLSPSSCTVHPLFIHCSATVCPLFIVLFIHYSPARKQCKSRTACRSYWPCSNQVAGACRSLRFAPLCRCGHRRWLLVFGWEAHGIWGACCWSRVQLYY